MFSVSAARLVQRFPQRANLARFPVRYLNIHEYNSMDILKENGVPVPLCYVATTPGEASEIFREKLNKRK